MFCQYFGFLLASKEGGDKFKQISIYYLLSMFSLQKKNLKPKLLMYITNNCIINIVLFISK
jgi:hypothetical protein